MSRALDAWASATAPPLTPSAGEARRQLLAELSKPGYAQDKPTLGDTILGWIENLLNALQPTTGGGVPGFNLGPLVIVVLVLAAIVVAFLVFGVPRLNRNRKGVGTLFGEQDERDSITLRRAADRAAGTEDYATAIAEAFRAIARGMAERTVLATFPGTTAHGFAGQAAECFPTAGDALRAAADSFDGVRYLGASGSEREWLEMAALEAGLRSARPRPDGVLAKVDA